MYFSRRDCTLPVRLSLLPPRVALYKRNQKMVIAKIERLHQVIHERPRVQREERIA
jgi:hypothetical protein